MHVCESVVYICSLHHLIIWTNASWPSSTAARNPLHPDEPGKWLADDAFKHNFPQIPNIYNQNPAVILKKKN